MPIKTKTEKKKSRPTVSTLENFEIVTIHRSKLLNAPYNPRKLSEAAEKKLRRFIKEKGFLAPAAIWNVRTGNIVGGHQRIKIFDQLKKTQDYELRVSKVDLSADDEIKANIQLNNPGMQGEWDNEMLGEIRLSHPEIDFINDLGFEKPELDFIFDGQMEIDSPAITETETSIQDILKIKEQKKEHRDKVKAANHNGESDNIVEHDDYFVTIAFNTNQEKWDFMKSIHRPKEAKYIKGADLAPILKQEKAKK